MNVYSEMEMYEAFHRLHEKYGKPFLDWYHDSCETISGNFPTITIPKNEMERDVMEATRQIKHPREFRFDEITEFEEKVCKFLAHGISCSRIINNEKDKMIMFRDRYSWFRHYYIIKLEP